MSHQALLMGLIPRLRNKNKIKQTKLMFKTTITVGLQTSFPIAQDILSTFLDIIHVGY